jgi:signal transduction histidine kinase
MPEWAVGLTLTCRIRDENAPEFGQLLRDFLVPPSPRCLSREAYRQAGEAERYQLLERWSDARHLGAHLASDGHRALLGGIRALGTLERTETFHLHDAALESRGPSLAHLAMHDLQNPLAAIAAHVALVRDDLAAVGGFDTQVGDLSAASAACEHLEGMIAELLVLTRLGARHLRAVRTTTGVDELVRAVARSFAAVATARGIVVETDAEPVVARVDATLVRRLLENLVSNALRHASTADRIQLAVRAEGEDVRLAVRNTGPAVPDSILAILDPGSAGARARRGLGLYVCQLVAHAHGGRIAHVPRPGWNVSFEATLPVSEAGGSLR